MNIKLIFNTLGRVITFEAIFMVLPVLCSFLMGDNGYMSFFVAMAICLVFGIPLSFIKPKKKRLYSREGFVIVALSWIALSIFGAIPFTVSGHIPSFIDAVFETASGFSTTGASILKDVEALPESLIFWRSFTHWIGGMGVVVFLVAVLPLSGGSNMYLMKAESPGPSVSKLVPSVRSTAKILYSIYLGITFLEIVFLLFGGMGIFETLCITFGTVGTGGFAVRNSGFADYSSYTQVVVTVFMILSGINFSVYYLIIMKRFTEAMRSSELWTYLGIIAISVAAITVSTIGITDSVGTALKHSAFQVGSIITTTGFATCDFDAWPEFSKTILVILMFVGASAGSTGGGIKVSRIILLFKGIVKEIKIIVHPRTMHRVSMDGKMVDHETLRAVNVYMASYFVIFALSLVVISLDNMDFTTNFTAVLATLNNIGPGLSKVGPVMNFSEYSDLSKVMLTFGMLAGRLEIFPMLVLFSPQIWRK